LYDILESPASSAVAGACIATWLYTLHYEIPFDRIAFSYGKVVINKEYWRVLTASFSHSGIMHLCFNLSALWSCNKLELMFGSLWYLKISLVLLVFSMVCMTLAYHFLIYYLHKDTYLHVLSVGYSW